MKRFLLIAFGFIFCNYAFSQNDSFSIDYSFPQKYSIKGIKVIGNEDIDHNLIISFSGLSIGSEIYIPGDKISNAIRGLWKQKLFSNVAVYAEDVQENDIYLLIEVKTRPRLSRFSITGVTKSDAEKIKEKISLVKNEIVTQQILFIVKNQISDYYIEKGFLYPEIDITEQMDSLLGGNYIALNINIKKNTKVKIKEIIIEGNNHSREEKKSKIVSKFNHLLLGDELVSDKKIMRLLKKTKQYSKINFFRPSKFISKLYEEDKQRVIEYYNSLGFRDASIISDTVIVIDKEFLQIRLNIHEGNRYYVRNISWTGNVKYSNEQLDAILGIKKGDIYKPGLFAEKLYGSMNSVDISSLYMDNGYLFFNIEPVEKQIDNDSIDIEIRIFEGPPAVISEVTISGNLRTSDHVILREIRTKPGQLFSRDDIIRSQRELVQLGYFDDQQMEVIPKPNPQNGTVAIEYKLVEKPSDQFQLQGGWGNKQFVGSAGFLFSNFSTRKMFKAKEWRPLPSGDGQRLSFSFQSNAIYYSSVNLSFTEPWFGGKKPNAFSISLYRSLMTNGISKEDEDRQEIKITGITIGLGKRLTFPDDWFTLYNSITFQRYDLDNYTGEFTFTDGYSNNLSIQHVVARNSIDHPIYPRSGSNISLSIQWTPPYSLFTDKDYTNLSLQEKFKWNEYHKWRFDANWYVNVIDKLVINPRIQFGFLGAYNSQIGITPFERFYVGGDGLTGYNLDGRDLIALRGYENNSLTAESPGQKGATIFNKYTFEVRYPFSLNPNATIYGLVFAEAGNSWMNFKDFNPFQVYRSLGAGIRIYMAMFGLLGFDWGYGFDNVPNYPNANKGQFHISIGQQF